MIGQRILALGPREFCGQRLLGTAGNQVRGTIAGIPAAKASRRGAASVIAAFNAVAGHHKFAGQSLSPWRALTVFTGCLAKRWRKDSDQQTSKPHWQVAAERHRSLGP